MRRRTTESADSMYVCLKFDKKKSFLFYRWYVKANEINPKNGKPYNQLALLAVYAVS